MDNRQTQLVYAAQREQEKQRMEYERRRQQERRVEESYTPGTFAYRQGGCMDSIDNAVSNFIVGRKTPDQVKLHEYCVVYQQYLYQRLVVEQ